MGVRGAKPPEKFVILRIKNKRFSLKDFNFTDVSEVYHLVSMY